MILLEQLIKKWNEESKCGKCWKLVITLNDHCKGNRNLYNPNRDDECCCTHVFFDGIKIRAGEDREHFTGGVLRKWCEYTFHLKILEVSDFLMSKGDEYGCKNNIYRNHIEPLFECLGCGINSDLCSIDASAEITRNDVEGVDFSEGDVNWAGIDYWLGIRIYKE